MPNGESPKKESTSTSGFDLTFKKWFVSFSNENNLAKPILNTAHHGWMIKKNFHSRLLKTAFWKRSDLYLVPEDFCKKGMFLNIL